jgi:hypothetical protein
MKRICLLAILLLPQLAFAQKRSVVISDRPGFGRTPVTVGKHYFQMQMGHEGGRLQGSRQGENAFARGIPNQSSFFFRFGVSANTEIHLASTYSAFRRTLSGPVVGLINTDPNYYPANYNSRWNNLQLGGRHTLLNENLQDPFSLGIIGSYTHLAAPDYSRHLDANGNAQLGLLASKQISNGIAALGNIGLNQPFGGSINQPNVYYVVNFSFDLGKNLSSYFETRQDFLTADGGGNVSNFNSGLVWKLTPNFQLDVYGGYIRTDLLLRAVVPVIGPVFPSASRENYWFLAGGLSWKIKALPTKSPKS